MAERLPSSTGTGVPETVHRLMQDASDEHAGKVRRVAFDASQRATSLPAHWPPAACLGPGEYCTPRYMIVDYLGRGGIAEVYEVRDMLKETYEALKVVRIEGVRTEILEKVAAEARSLNRVEHTNLLRVYNAGILEEKKLLYFAMERLSGMTLQQKIARAEGPRARPPRRR